VGPRRFLFKVASRFARQQTGAARLQVLDGMDQGRALTLRQGTTHTIGSHGSCSLIVRGEGVEPRHAAILAQPRGCIVADLGSQQGVWFHAERVGRRELCSGDEIKLGTVRLLYRLEA
jgi:pSer/pThr/pTyr-binding forkhead associated (FHA) protein